MSQVSAVQFLSSLSSSPSVQCHCAADAVALTTHHLFTQHGFQLLSTQASADSVTPDQQSLEYLPSDWNASSETRSFIYKHPEQSNVLYQVKTMKMGDHFILNSMKHYKSTAHNTDPTLITIDIRPADFIHERLDWSANLQRSSFKDLEGLLATIKSRLIIPLLPHEESAVGGGDVSTGERPSQELEFERDGLPVRPPFRGDEDETEINRPFGGRDEILRQGIARPGQQASPWVGDFHGDIDPLTGGPPGSLMGPEQLAGRPVRPRGDPGMRPRFDPYFGEPDNDVLMPPGAGRRGGPGVGPPGGSGSGTMFGSSRFFM